MSVLKLNRFEICDYALISKEGKLSVIGVFDRIFVQRLPAQHPSMCFVVGAEGTPKSDHKVKLVIIDPSGKKVNEIPMNVTINEAGQITIIANFSNLRINEQGILTIACYDGEAKIGTKELILSKAPMLQGSMVKN